MRDRRKRYFEWVRAWSDGALAGESPEAIGPPPFPYCVPFWRLGSLNDAVCQGNRCPLVGRDAGSNGLDHIEEEVRELMVGPGERSDGVKRISDFTKNAKHLVIVDPYAYRGNGADYVRDLAEAAGIGDGSSLEKIHIIYERSNRNATFEGIAACAAQADVTLTDRRTELLHDRVWIADGKRGLVVGTSLNSLGYRAAFLLELPNEDLKRVLEFIDKEGLMNPNDGARHGGG